MGWTDSQLHEFELGRVIYGLPDPDVGGIARRTPLNRRLAKVLGDKPPPNNRDMRHHGATVISQALRIVYLQFAR
jgi:hypothetical protein